MTYRDREVMARWRLGFAVEDIAAKLQMAALMVEEVIVTHRKPDEDPSPRRVGGRA